MKMFGEGRTGIVKPVLWMLGGAFLGAAAAALLTPSTGAQLRGMVKSLFAFGNSEEEPLDRQLERMENEGGVTHAVAPPTGRDESRTHS